MSDSNEILQSLHNELVEIHNSKTIDPENKKRVYDLVYLARSGLAKLDDDHPSGTDCYKPCCHSSDLCFDANCVCKGEVE